MKHRLSFVTNSSSSSFVLAVKNEGFLTSGNSALETFVKNIVFSDAEVIRTVEELKSFAKGNIFYAGSDEELEQILENPDGYEYEAKEYKKLLKLINDGFMIVEKTIDNHEENMINLLCEIAGNKNIIMVRSEC